MNGVVHDFLINIVDVSDLHVVGSKCFISFNLLLKKVNFVAVKKSGVPRAY